MDESTASPVAQAARTPKAPPSKPERGAGFSRLMHDLRHRRQRYRQFVGVAFVFLITGLGTPSELGIWIGGAVAVLGMAVRLWASGFVLKNQVLATVGPYGWVRHPLYVGNILIGVGFCVASGLWWSWPVFLAVMLYFYPHTIRYEDAKLRRLFGEPWDHWAARTRALLPSLRPYSREGAPGGPSEWSLRLSMMRNGEPLHIVIGFACLAYLRFVRLG